MPLTVIDPRSLDQTGDYTVNNITATGVATLSSPANLSIGGGTTAQVLSTNGNGVLTWVTAAGGGGGGGVTSYALEANLPVSATNGDLGYVTGTQKMYLYNGTIWVLVFTATTPNLAPAITAGPDAGYLLSTSGTPVVITMAAQDPESVPITWSYTITAGNLGSVATITQSTNVFTITPSTITTNGGTFELTITASDGVNLANARTNFRLRFTVEEPIYGLQFVSSIAPPTAVFSNSTNLGFGQVIAASGGTLAVLGYGVSVTGTRDTTKSSVYIYTTLAGADPVYQTRIDLPTDSTYTTAQVNKMCLTSNMLIVPGRDNAAGNLVARKWYVYFKTNDTTWTLTQTINHGENSQGNTIPSIMDISSTGLVFVCASQAFKTEIYTRDTTATTTWTLRQTILNADMPNTIANNDIFPRFINVSASGRHIAFSGRDPDQVSPAVTDSGKVLIFTNTTYSSGGYAWGATFTYAPNVMSSLLTVTTSSKYDDIFYVYTRSSVANTDSLRCLTYTSASNTWSNNTYDTLQVNKFLNFVDTQATWVDNTDPYLLVALAGPNASMSFLLVKRSVNNGSLAALTVFKFTTADLSTNVLSNKLISSYTIGSGSTNINTSFSWNASSEIPNPGLQALSVNLCIDDLAGEIFLAAPLTSWGGITSSGVVHRYNLTSVVSNATTKEYLNSAPGSFTVIVPAKVNYMSAVIIGAGGGGCGSVTTSDSGGGAGGGALVAFSNYPVTPGYSVTGLVGAAGTASSTRVTAGGGGQSYVNYNGGTSIWYAFGGAGGPPAGGGAGGGTTVPTLSPTPTHYSVLQGTGGTGGTGNSSTTAYGCGGGGAGGYGSVGGAGQSSSTGLTAGAGNNGGGGGGGGAGTGQRGMQGGNTGVYGAGASGQAALGQNGGDGSVDSGLPTSPVGGGGGYGSGWSVSGSGGGGTPGVVRIIFSHAPIYTFGSTTANSTSILVRTPAYTGT